MATGVAVSTERVKLRRDNQKNSYERRDNES